MFIESKVGSFQVHTFYIDFENVWETVEALVRKQMAIVKYPQAVDSL
jgi:hypothetical protein